MPLNAKLDISYLEICILLFSMFARFFISDHNECGKYIGGIRKIRVIIVYYELFNKSIYNNDSIVHNIQLQFPTSFFIATGKHDRKLLNRVHKHFHVVRDTGTHHWTFSLNDGNVASKKNTRSILIEYVLHGTKNALYPT